MDRFLLISLSCVFIYGCSSKLSHKEQSYFEFKKQVSNEVFSGFPLNEKEINSSSNQTVLFPASLYAIGYCGLFIVFEYDSIEFERVHEELASRKLFESSVFDSCNAVVSKSYNTENRLC